MNQPDTILETNAQGEVFTRYQCPLRNKLTNACGHVKAMTLNPFKPCKYGAGETVVPDHCELRIKPAITTLELKRHDNEPCSIY